MRGDEEILVQGTRESIVAGDHYRNVRGNEVVTIEKDLILHVVGRQRIVIEGRAPSPEGGDPGEAERGGAQSAPASRVAEPPVAAAVPAAIVPSWPPADHAAQELAHAKLVWSMASLPEELQEQGAAIEQHAAELSHEIAKLRGDVGTWLAAGRPAGDIETLRTRTVEVLSLIHI